MNTGESCGTKDESDGESGDGEYGEEFDSVEDESDNEFVFNDLDEKSNPSQTIQFISDDQICEESKNNHYFSLRSKRFQSSSARKLERERPNFSRRTRAETLATQAIIISEN